MIQYQEEMNPADPEAISESIAIAKPFSPWTWEKSDLASYHSLINQLHTQINHANQSIVNHRLIRVAAFDAENLSRRLEAFNRLFLKKMDATETPSHSPMGLLFLRYSPVIFLSLAILKYSSGVSRLISKDFSEKFPHKQHTSNDEAALLDIYYAQRALSTHEKFQQSIKSKANDARPSTTKAAAARDTENREIANRLKAWYIENHTKFRNIMDTAAEAAKKIEPASFRTARRYVAAAAKGDAPCIKRKTGGKNLSRGHS